MGVEDFKARLRGYSEGAIIIGPHAIDRATIRNISVQEIRGNIHNPERLRIVIPEQRGGEMRFKCYFDYSNNLAHMYVLVLNKSIKVVTVIKIRKKWQKIVERYGKAKAL